MTETIEEDPGKAPTVAELAAEAGYSADHFSRLFRLVHGCGPQEYIIQSRVRLAKRLLLNGEMSVKEVARWTGYQNVFFFSRQFKEKTGLSPSQWRQGETKGE